MPYDEFTIDTGECLAFRMVHRGQWVPVVISREAMVEHFGALRGGGLVLIDAFRIRVQEIEECVRPLIQPGVRYGRDNPLRVDTADLTYR